MPVNNSKKLNKTMESVNQESHKSKDVKKPEDMIVSAIRRLKDPKGSSLTDIKKFLISNHQEDAINGINAKRVLKQAVNRGILSEIDGKYQVVKRGRRRTKSRGSPKPQTRRSGSKRTSKSRKRDRSASKNKSKRRKRGTSGSRRTSKSRRRRNTSGGRQRQSGSRKKQAGSKSRSRRRRTHKGHVEGDDCE